MSSFPVELRVALEMALHEDLEKRAMEDELKEMEAAWKNAEEIAAIADRLFLSRDVSRRFRTLKRVAARRRQVFVIPRGEAPSGSAHPAPSPAITPGR